MLSSADKARELINMCQFTESNAKYSKFGFGFSNLSRPILFGPGGHVNLLNVLQSAIVPNKEAKVFEYTLIQQ